MKTLLSFVLSLFVLSTYAQTEILAFETFDDKWGYIDPAGNVIIQDEYIDAHPFTHVGIAMARQKKGGKWILIDQNNNQVTVAVEDFTPKASFWKGQKGFRNDLLPIIVKKKHGYINAAGKVIIQPEFHDLSAFKGSYAIGRIDSDYFILDETGKRTKVQGNPTHVSHFVNGYAPFRNSAKLFGIVDGTGAIVIEPKFKKVGYFYNGLAWARNQDDKIGFINTSGEWVVQPQYSKVTDFDTPEKIAVVYKDGKPEFLRLSGETFSVDGTTASGSFSEGLAWVRVGDKFGYINTSGEWVVKPVYQKVIEIKNGFGLVKKNDSWGVINKTGEIVVEPKYQNIKKFSNGFIAVRKEGKWGFINSQGNLVVKHEYDAIRPFKNGYAAVRIGAKWGLINKKGELVIEPKYKRLKDVEIIN